MTRTLLDTQAFLWALNGERLSVAANARIAERGSEVLLSYASVWEISIKHGKGKLKLPAPPEAFLLDHLTRNQITLLPIAVESIFTAGRLPYGRHKDPFDRLIAAQCLRHDLTLVSSDAAFDAYGVRRVW